MGFDDWISKIEGDNAAALREFLSDQSIRECIDRAPGAPTGVYAKEGGYKELMTAKFDTTNGSSDELIRTFLDHIEKPFAYDIDRNGNVIVNADMSDEAREVFRARIIKKYKFNI